MNTENIISKLNVNNDRVVRKQENVTEYVRLMSKLGNEVLTVFLRENLYNFFFCLQKNCIKLLTINKKNIILFKKLTVK